MFHYFHNTDVQVLERVDGLQQDVDYCKNKTLLDLSYNLLYLVFSHLHNTDVQSLKRTNIKYNNIFDNCCGCKTKRLNSFNINLAARNGHMEVVKWLHNNGKSYSTRAMDLASRYGHLDVVKWLHYNGKRCTTNAMDWAAENGHLDVVKWLHNNRKRCTNDAMDWADENGHLDVVKFLYNNMYMNYAARDRFMLPRGYSMCSGITSMAVGEYTTAIIRR